MATKTRCFNVLIWTWKENFKSPIESDDWAALARWLGTLPLIPLSPEAALEFPATLPCSQERLTAAPLLTHQANKPHSRKL